MGHRSRWYEPHLDWRSLVSALGSRARALLLFLLLLCVTSCARDEGQLLRHWTLQVPGVPSSQVELPTHLSGALPARQLTYRLLTTVRLEPELLGRDVDLCLTYLPAFVALRVNGQLARLQAARPVREGGSTSMPRRWLLPASTTRSSAPITLEFEVSHGWTHSAWLDAVPELVPAGHPVPQAERNRLLNEQGGWFGLIALSQVGITFLVVYFWDRRRRAYLFFAVQGLTASYYPAYVLGLPSTWLSWPVQNVLLAQSLAVAPIISVYFTHEFFGLARPHRAWLMMLLVALASPLTVALRDSEFHDLSYASPIVVICVLSAVSYQLVTGVRLLRSYADRGTVVFFLCCWLALGGSSWIDLLAWLGCDLLVGGRPACVGLGFFGIFQSLLLGRSHFRSLAEADRLNERLRGQVKALEERRGEIAILNDELRRQIGRRSADILTALTASHGKADGELAVGHVVEARYRVLRKLGRGGMATVYEVERLSDHRHFALKVSREVRGLALARLAREAQIATRVHHANVVSIVDADVGQEGYAYLVMELVEGRTLAECHDRHDLAWCLEVLRQILEGVKALHEQGIIHRDLKPNNVLLAAEDSRSPSIKITDFGISRWLQAEPDASTPAAASTHERTRSTRRPRLAVDAHGGTRSPGVLSSEADTETLVEDTPASQVPSPHAREPSSSPRLTQTGVISGTPLYVAPELADTEGALSPAIDVFSFGVVAYRLLTGRLPHREPPLYARMAGRDIPPVTPVASLSTAVTPELACAVDACLASTPAERPTIDALQRLVASELERVVHGQSEEPAVPTP
jgi:serine/threonine protein kinase